jgi:uncharacterized metal-binding protein
MPSGKTHDAITLMLAVPTAAVAWFVTWDAAATVVATLAMLFGGFMFGPDLDIDSKQYRRWGPVRRIWLPYRAALKHRSRLSHGIVFGTAFRVLYFLVVVGVTLSVALVVRDVYLYQLPIAPNLAARGAADVWTAVSGVEPRCSIAAFAGLWLGAASHTLADVIGSTLKQIWHAL